MPSVSFDTLNACRSCCKNTFSDFLYKQHHFVKSVSGKWYSTLGPPENCSDVFGTRLVQITSRTWHTVFRSKEYERRYKEFIRDRDSGTVLKGENK